MCFSSLASKIKTTNAVSNKGHLKLYWGQKPNQEYNIHIYNRQNVYT